MLRTGQKLRIIAQLVRARDGFSLWSGRFDRELTDVVAIQDDISRGIVNSLRLTLGRGRRRYETRSKPTTYIFEVAVCWRRWDSYHRGSVDKPQFPSKM